MEDFHCDFLELVFIISARSFDKEALLKAIGQTDEGLEYFRLIFGSRDNPDKQHAHMEIRFTPAKQVRIRIDYHKSRGDVEDAQAPFMEDCAQWLAGIIRTKKVSASINVSYVFDKSFSPRMALPFPLIGADALSGALVTGFALKLRDEAEIDRVFIQSEEGLTPISIFKEAKIQLKDFDLYAELERLQIPIMSLVEKKDKTHEGSQKKRR